MPLASTWLDLVVGIDFHLEIVPGSPFPVPFPHPFVGVIWDLAGTLVGEMVSAALTIATFQAPSPSGPVLIHSLPGAVTGDATKMPGGHILVPPGTAWAPVPRVPLPLGGKRPLPEAPLPPPADAMLLFGSQTVELRGSKAVRVGEVALPCSDPVRLPTGTVLPQAAGNPVLVGGPPAVDGMMLAMTAGMRALRTRWASGLVHGAIEKAARGLGLPKHPGRFRQFLHDAACFVTGHPVNVANGCLHTEWTDFELPGPLPLAFSRRYRSGFSGRDSPLGHGWSHGLDQKVWIEPDCVVVLTEDGRELEFDTFDLKGHVMRKGDQLYDPISRLTLRSLGQFRWEIETHEGLVKEFGPIPGERSSDRDRGLARLTRIRSRAGDTVRLSYDARARLTEVVDCGGRRILFEYTPEGRLKHLWLPAPSGEGMRQHAHFLYDAAGDLVEARDAAGKPVRFEYDRHLLVRETDRNGLNFYFIYDGCGPFARCVRTWGDGGLLDHVLVYDRENRRTLVTNSLGAATVYEMNGLGLVTAVTDARGGKTRYEHDEGLRVLCRADAFGHTVRYVYDERGNRIQIQDADGAVTKVRYDALNNPVWLRTPKGSQWRWTYDPLGRMICETDPLGGSTRLFYEDGRLAAVQDPAGYRTGLGYDTAGNVTDVHHPDGTRTHARYDALGRAIWASDAKGNVQRRTYDAQGRLLRVDEPDGNLRVFEYDPSGNLLRAQDRLRDVRLTYVGLGKVASRSIGGKTVCLEYDAEQHLTAVINEKGVTHRFERDPTGHIRAEIGFDGQRRLYARDLAGRVTKVYRPGVRNTSTFAHDAIGRLTRVEHADGSHESFVYDEDGALIEGANDAITVRMERDALGRVVKESQGEHWVASRYDHGSRRVGLETSLGLRQTMKRDAMGDVVGITARQGDLSWDATFRRDALGLELERLLPGGARSQWWRDAVGRPRAHLIGKGADPDRRLHCGRRYTWGVDDRLEALHEEGRDTEHYEHDARGFLTAVTGPEGRTDLRLPDEVGNLFRTREGTDREYGPSGELRAVRASEGVTTYAYNAEGQLSRRVGPDGKVWTYHWNGSGRLARVDRPEGEPVLLTYDALGRRISKQTGPRWRRWIWDRNVLLHEAEEESSPGNETPPPAGVDTRSSASPRGPPEADCITWIFGDEGFAPLGRLGDGQAHSVVCDHRDAPLCVLDADGLVAWQGHTDAWGRVTSTGNATLCPWRFAGQYEDEETGLYYNRFRYYDPGQGRYISRDPLGLAGGLALYGYVGDPYVSVDPLGLTKSGYASIRSKLRDAGLHGLPGGRTVTGPFRFRAPQGFNPAGQLPRGPQGGYLDRFGNEWVQGPYHGYPMLPFQGEWDVQLSRQGQAWYRRANPGQPVPDYLNIRPDGHLSH